MTSSDGKRAIISRSFGDAFASAVLDDVPTNPADADGVAAVRLIEAVRASARWDGAEARL